MARNITVTFADGTAHTYQNAPDGATPEQVQARAEKEFSKSVTALDGGRTQEQPSELTRQLGLTARAGIKGALALPGMVADAASGVVNTGLDAALGKGEGFRFQTTGGAIDNLLTHAGVAQPKNSTERVVQDIVGGMAGAGGSVAAGKLMQHAAAPLIQKAGELFSAGPGIQTLGGAMSAGAAGVTRENGGGTGAQVIAGVLGAGAPSAALAGSAGAVRGVLRGGEAGRQKVVGNIELFRDAAGTFPSVGQASEGRIPRAIESVLSKTPGGAGVLQKSAQAKADAMSKSVIDTAEGLAPGASVVNAGESIEQGVMGFKEGFKVVQNRLYSTLDKHIPEGTPIQVGNTEIKLKELNAGIQGAPNISEFFKNSKIKGIDKALQADLELSANGGALPYEAVKKLRTLIGNEIADNSLLADVPRSKWTALYAALSDDLGIAAKQAGPQAEQSWQWANQYTKGQLGRLESLSKVVGKDSPEKIFSAAMAGTSEGNTILKRVVDAIPKENRKELAAAVLKRMGQATAGNQNAAGDAFSTETFLTNINRLSPEARSTLFGRLGVPDVQNKLGQLTQMAGNMREGSKVFANPSGTQPAISAQAAGYGGLVALLTGHPGVAAASVGAPVAANRLANLMTSPRTVNMLARSTTMPQGTAASELNSLTRIMGY